MDRIEHKKGKIYYSMGEVAEMFDVNPSLIRFWESKFDILKPHKNKKGNRMFTPQDVDNLKLIYHLVKEKGMTLAGAQKKLKNNPQGIPRDMEVIDRLMNIKAVLMEIREELKSDDGEVYRDNEAGMEDHVPAVKPRRVKNEAPKAIDNIFIDLRTEEEEWIGGELDKLDELDEEIDSISKAAGITPAEADQLLEDTHMMPENTGFSIAGSAKVIGDAHAIHESIGPSIADPASAAGNTRIMPTGADFGVASPAKVAEGMESMDESVGPSATDPAPVITEDELAALGDDPQPDYPEEHQSLFDDADGEAGEPSLFDAPPAAETKAQEEPVRGPQIIEQTLF